MLFRARVHILIKCNVRYPSYFHYNFMYSRKPYNLTYFIRLSAIATFESHKSIPSYRKPYKMFYIGCFIMKHTCFNFFFISLWPKYKAPFHHFLQMHSPHHHSKHRYLNTQHQDTVLRYRVYAQ